MTRLPILTFHAIDERPSPISISASWFADVIAGLASDGWRALSLDALIAGHAAGVWPDRSLFITFDDGFASFAERAWPVLTRHGFGAALFVVSGFVGRTNDWPGQPSWAPRLPLAGWDDLAALARAGVAIGSHSITHRALADLPPDDRRREIVDARRSLEDRLAAPVEMFAYPYGRTSREAEADVAAAYRAGFGTRLAFARRRNRLTSLDRLDGYYLSPRIARTLDTPAATAYLAVRRAGRALRGAWS